MPQKTLGFLISPCLRELERTTVSGRENGFEITPMRVKKIPRLAGDFLSYFVAGVPLLYCSIMPLIWMPVALVGSTSMYLFQYGTPFSGCFISTA